MKISLKPSAVLAFILFLGCAKGYDSTSASSSSPSFVANPSVTLANMPTGANVASVSVGCGYVNEPCVSVTICEPGTSNCQTIDNLLLDTGSYGLRVFSQAINLNLVNSNDGSGHTFAECVSYADGSSEWGPVTTADISIGTTQALAVPMQIIDATFPTAPGTCTDLDTSPADNGFNGILGVGLFEKDCGPNCVASSAMDIYYKCTAGGACAPTTMTLIAQVTNPVAKMPAGYNNGVILQLPAVGDGGTVGAVGALVLGIGTVANNTPATTPQIFLASALGYFKTTLGSNTYNFAFIDSGSNGLFFPGGNLTMCSGEAQGFYCPSGQLNTSATAIAAIGGVQAVVPFSIADASYELSASNPNIVFNNLGASMSGTFDWGLPFFLGRPVYVGLNGVSVFGQMGPLWAF